MNVSLLWTMSSAFLNGNNVLYILCLCLLNCDKSSADDLPIVFQRKPKVASKEHIATVSHRHLLISLIQK